MTEAWLSGFINTDGSFSLSKYKKPKGDLRFNIIPQIIIYQDNISLIDFLNKYPLQGVKKLDYLDFCEGYNLYLKKEHLNPIGITKILSIAEGMNTDRNL